MLRYSCHFLTVYTAYQVIKLSNSVFYFQVVDLRRELAMHALLANRSSVLPSGISHRTTLCCVVRVSSYTYNWAHPYSILGRGSASWTSDARRPRQPKSSPPVSHTGLIYVALFVSFPHGVYRISGNKAEQLRLLFSGCGSASWTSNARRPR